MAGVTLSEEQMLRVKVCICKECYCYRDSCNGCVIAVINKGECVTACDGK